MRAISATVALLACIALLWVLGDIAWRSLSRLPVEQQLEAARGGVRASQGRAQAPGSGESRSEPVREENRTVRFIEEDGIVGIRIEGPLERAPARVEEESEDDVAAEAETEQPDVYRLVVIESAGLIDARSHKIALAHIDAPGVDMQCTNASGTRWPCGRRARTALRRLIRRRAIECFDADRHAAEETPADAPAAAAPTPVVEGVRPAECKVAHIDLSRWLVENGWADPTDSAPAEWQELHAEAKSAGRGLYEPNAR